MYVRTLVYDKKIQAKMGVEYLTCEIVLHTALPSEQTQFCNPYSVNEVK